MSETQDSDVLVEDICFATKSKNESSFGGRPMNGSSVGQSKEFASLYSSRSRSYRACESAIDMDFDALFSSSPLAQSTPRIRLEPTFEEDGGKKLKNVPADSHSLFDRDHSKGGQISGKDLQLSRPHKVLHNKPVVKRETSQVKDSRLGVESHLSKRRKKHPSPSGNELEGLGDALKQYSHRMVSLNPDPEEQLSASFGELRTGMALSARDNNALLTEDAKRGKKGNRLNISEKPKKSTSTPALAKSPKHPAIKPGRPSMIPKAAGASSLKRHPEPPVSRLVIASGSAMDIDELQWDNAAYHIGMRGGRVT